MGGQAPCRRGFGRKKRLNFLSSALELTQVSVEMKVAIEQMREQVQNIE